MKNFYQQPSQKPCRQLTARQVFPDTDFPLDVREIHQYFVYGQHSHCDFLELVVITCGRANHIINGVSTPVGVGDLLMIPENVYHGYNNIADFRYYNIIFDPRRLQLPMEWLAEVPGSEYLFGSDVPKKISPVIHLPGSVFDKVRTLTGDLHNTLIKNQPGMKFTATAQLLMLLDICCRNFNGSLQYEQQKNIHRLSKLIDALEQDIARSWTIRDMCHLTNLSRPVLFKEFQKVYNTTPMDHLLSIRMRHACIMLSNTSSSITEIALACGFVDSSYFVMRFRKRTGMTPRQFRLQSLSIISE